MNAPSHPARPRAAGALPTAGLVVGILALLLSPVGVGALFAVVGLMVSVVALARDRTSPARAWWGASLSVLGLAASVGMILLYARVLYPALSQAMRSEQSALREWEGQTAPPLTLETLSGETVRLSELRGRRVVLDFWATWCGPCRQEIPHFIELARTIPARELVILGLSREDEDTVRAFAEKQGINYPLASADDLPPPYSLVRALPTTFFIDPQGSIDSILVGYHDLETLRTHAMGN